jgi:hypothetical protein
MGTFYRRHAKQETGGFASKQEEGRTGVPAWRERMRDKPDGLRGRGTVRCVGA